MFELAFSVHRGRINIYGYDVIDSSGYHSNFVFRPFWVEIWSPETDYPGFPRSIIPQQNTSTKQFTSNTGLHIKLVVFVQALFSDYCGHVAIRQSRQGQARIVTEFSPSPPHRRTMEVHGNWHLPGIEQEVSPSKSENGSNAGRHIWLNKRAWNQVQLRHEHLFYEKEAVFPSTIWNSGV